MNRISKKEFASNVFKYLKLDKVILTSHGKDAIEITIKVLNSTPIQEDNTSIDIPNSTSIGELNTSIQVIRGAIESLKGRIEALEPKEPKNKPNEINGKVLQPHRTDKQERIETAKKIPGVKIAIDLAPPEVTKEFPDVKTMEDYRALQARVKDKEYRMTHYSCGCEKKDGALLCTKHNRT